MSVSVVIVAALALYYSWAYLSGSFRSHLCVNELVDSKPSPNTLKKVVIFTSDCGATTGWITKATIMDVADSLDNGTVSNVLSIDSNNGRAFPLAPGGWPVIEAEWKDSNSLELRYSSNAAILYEDQEVDAVHIELWPTTSFN